MQLISGSRNPFVIQVNSYTVIIMKKIQMNLCRNPFVIQVNSYIKRWWRNKLYCSVVIPS